jgi:hypothetical protein
MNSKVNSVKQGSYESKRRCRTWLAFNLSHTVPSWPLYIGGRSPGSGRVWYILQYRHTVRTRISTTITIGPSLTGLEGTQLTGSIIYILVSSPWDSTRIEDLGWISNLKIFNLIISLTSSYLQIFELVFWHILIMISSQGVLMNKPDNSDGSRGQLSIGTDTCHLLQIQSPWTWIWETSQTHSFAAFRTYKEWIPVVLRVPSASTKIFLRVVDTDTYQQSASVCVYRATQDGSWGLTFVIYFNHGIQVLSQRRNSRIIFHSLVWLNQYMQLFELSSLTFHEYLPMGVINVLLAM